MLTLHYLNCGSTPTFPHRAVLRALGLRFDSLSKRWYAVDSEAVAQSAITALGFGYVTEEQVEALPPGPKPRGRAFSRGSDPRRRGQQSAEPQSTPEPEPFGWTQVEPPSVTAEPSPTTQDTAAQLAALLAKLASAPQGVDVAAVQAIVDAATGPIAQAVKALQAQTSAQPLHLSIQVANLPPVQIGLAHKDLQRIVRRLSIRNADGSRRFPNCRLVGPAGSGKTTLAMQVAQALGLQYVFMSAAPGMPESRLEGKRIQNIMTGEEKYVPSSLVTAYSEPALYLLDEADNLSGGTAVCVNMATGNGHWSLLDGTVIERHPDMVFCLAMNTWGNGQDRQYVREQQDAAFLDRFAGSSFLIDYDPAIEAAIAPDRAVRAKFEAVRTAAAGKVRRILSTRMLSAAHDIMQAEGLTVDVAIRETMPDWTAADLAAVGL